MKKVCLFFLFFILVFSFTGCSSIKQYKCSYSAIVNGSIMSSVSLISYKGDFVYSIKKRNTFSNQNTDKLYKIRDSISYNDSKYDGIKYYNSNIKVNDGVLINDVFINYKKIKIEKLINIDKSNKEIVKNDYVSLDLVLSYYRNLGATCKI